MRCYYVLVHGKLDWLKSPPEGGGDEFGQPAGFYCHRFVLASDEQAAAEKAFRRVRSNLDGWAGWLKNGHATLDLEAETVAAAPIYKLLVPENRGHTFYAEE